MAQSEPGIAPWACFKRARTATPKKNLKEGGWRGEALARASSRTRSTHTTCYTNRQDDKEELIHFREFCRPGVADYILEGLARSTVGAWARPEDESRREDMGGVLRLRAWLLLLAERGDMAACGLVKEEEHLGAHQDLWIYQAVPPAEEVLVGPQEEQNPIPPKSPWVERGQAPMVTVTTWGPCQEQAPMVEAPVCAVGEEAPWRAFKRRKKRQEQGTAAENEEAHYKILADKDRETVETLRLLLAN